MQINAKKTTSMVFNYTEKYQFSTRLLLNDEKIENLKSTKLLGTIISDDLSWDLNTLNIVTKANARMQLVRKVASFGASEEDIKNVYFLFVRSLLEQSATVWHSSITEENNQDLERVHKSAVKLILGEQYHDYKKGLMKLDMESLEQRRENLCLNFAIKCVKNPKTKGIFPKTIKAHPMETRKQEKFQVQHAHTERLKKSSVIYMQNILNQNEYK